MTITFRPAIRENVKLLVGIAGGTGSGKTYSAMRLATGLSGGKKFAVIDTENGRASYYADMFDFDVANLSAPFRPDAYTDAILAADKAGYPVIVVDSMSHEHAGDGGLLDWHEEEVDKLSKGDFSKREKVNMIAWSRVKQAHKQMVTKLLQVKAHVILCFRAEEKIDIVREGGKTKIVPKKSLSGLGGWVPISEKNLPYEMTLSFLLIADKPGYPHPIKLQEQHRSAVNLNAPLDENAGKLLAQWAAGGETSKPTKQSDKAKDKPADEPTAQKYIILGSDGKVYREYETLEQWLSGMDTLIKKISGKDTQLQALANVNADLIRQYDDGQMIVNILGREGIELPAPMEEM